MIITLTTCDNKNEWNEFLTKNNGSFLQSWQWAQTVAEKAHHIFVKKEDTTLAGVTFFIYKTKISPYAYIPRGPVYAKDILPTDQKNCDQRIIEHIQTEYPGLSHILLDPERPLTYFPKKYVYSTEEQKQPLKTAIVDLTKDIDEIRSNISKTKRQGIGYAQKAGVEAEIWEISSKPEVIEIFLSLLRATSRKKNISAFKETHIKNIWETGESMLFLSKHNESYESGALVYTFGNTATYVYAGAKHEKKKIMAPYFTLWNVIVEMKGRGYNALDLWGLNETRYPGVTAFKRSFHGNELEYPKPIFLICNSKKYYLYRGLMWIRKIIRSIVR